ncbi:C39 family peptidase [Actinoallomurus spadix]|uniref:Peptidase C39-like domain-containing protein n=1 Tax=Actinoallomurus spadix TaxID=79912 RepID=A0ABN0XA08_9ACTN|nr:C39 family peptidase [Actinoallomurus spadix]MCO5987892.1 C39 family peptidase [Actinoallomurus spadix]
MASSPRIAALAGAAALTVPLLAAAPAHAAPIAPTRTAPAASVAAPAQVGVAATKSVSIKVQEQQKYYWCAPAAGRALLSRLISKGLPSQSKLAGWMGTKPPNGTSTNGIRIGLRKALPTYGSGSYDVVTVSPGPQNAFYGSVESAVGTKKVVIMYRVLVGYKPWGSQYNDKAGHVMVVRGYTTGSSPKILWWDPADNTYHTASLAKSWASVKKGGHVGTVAAKS